MKNSYKGIRRHVFNILPAALINLMVGAGLGWTAPAIDHFTSVKGDFSVTNSDISWIASTFFAMEVISPIIASIFSDKLGRKPLLIISGFFMALSWIVVLISTSVYLIILSRIILGTSAGIFDITWSIYVGEVAKPSQRGIFGTIMVCMVIGGMMCEFLLSLFVPYIYLAIIPLVISTVAFIGTLFMREAPQFLLMCNKDEQAVETLAWFRATEISSVLQEFEEMKRHIEEEKQNRRTIKHFIQHTSEYKVYIMCVLVFAFAQLSGQMIILSYGPLVLDKYENIPSGNNLAFIYGLLQFIFVNLSPFLIETLGRRILLIFGFSMSGIIQASITILFYLDERNIVQVPYMPQIMVILFNFYGIVFAMCLLPTVYVIKSELFPQELKTIGSVSATIFNSSSEFVIMKIFFVVWSSLGLYANFAIYALVSLLSVIYIYVLIPETKGQSLVQIQKNINSNKTENHTTGVS